MSIDVHNLSEQAYRDKRLAIIESVESREEQVYLDSVNIATVGLGFNLRDREVVEIILKQFIASPDTDDISRFVDAAQSATDTQGAIASITATFNAILAKHNEPQVNEFRLTDREMNDIANEIADSRFENDISTHFTHSGFGARQFSYERLAIFSLAYNGGMGLIGTGLTSAINNGNRFKAWYEIRHNSNGGSSRSKGIAKRRYYEANLFGLFNDEDNPTQEEFDNIIDGLTENNGARLTKITNEENAWEKEIANAKRDYAGLPRAGSIPYISKAFLPLKSFALRRFLPMDLKEEIREKIEESEIDGQLILGMLDDQQKIAPREYPDEDKTNLLINIFTDREAEFAGGKGKDIIIGGNKDDTLDGGEGEDILVGGAGEDTLKGGAGFDSYYADDEDTISDKDSQPLAVLETFWGKSFPKVASTSDDYDLPKAIGLY